MEAIASIIELKHSVLHIASLGHCQGDGLRLLCCGCMCVCVSVCLKYRERRGEENIKHKTFPAIRVWKCVFVLWLSGPKWPYIQAGDGRVSVSKHHWCSHTHSLLHFFVIIKCSINTFFINVWPFSSFPFYFLILFKCLFFYLYTIYSGILFILLLL